MTRKFIFFILSGVLIINISQAQCFDFVKTQGFNELDTGIFIPEGRFDAMQLSEGDYLNVYKSFFRGKTYRVVVICDKNLPDLHFTIKDMAGKIIYDNTQDKYPKTWDYTSDRNQNLMVSLSIPWDKNSIPKSGCVAIILGYKIQ